MPVRKAEIEAYIREKLKAERYRHSIGVMETARDLARHYGVDVDKAELAGLLHDCGKQRAPLDSLHLLEAIGYVPNEVERFDPSLVHGRVGAILARERFHIEDEAVLSAIACHTTGKTGMTRLDKVIYIADYIEPNREGDWVSAIRSLAFEDLDRCLVRCADSTMSHVMRKGMPIHPDTVRMRNEILMGMGGRA